MSDNSEHLFSGEPQPVPELDVSTVHELRLRIAGLIMAEQVEIISAKRPERPVFTPQSDAELIQEVARMEDYIQAELPIIKRERAAHRKALWGVMNIIDELENEALHQEGH
jgi:hypothetical protein